MWSRRGTYRQETIYHRQTCRKDILSVLHFVPVEGLSHLSPLDSHLSPLTTQNNCWLYSRNALNMCVYQEVLQIISLMLFRISISKYAMQCLLTFRVTECELARYYKVDTKYGVLRTDRVQPIPEGHRYGGGRGGAPLFLLYCSSCMYLRTSIKFQKSHLNFLLSQCQFASPRPQQIDLFSLTSSPSLHPGIVAVVILTSCSDCRNTDFHYLETLQHGRHRAEGTRTRQHAPCLL